MSAARLLSDLEAIGVEVALRETGPVLTGAGNASVPPALLDRLKAYRSEIIAEVESRERERVFAHVQEALEHGTPCPLRQEETSKPHFRHHGVMTEILSRAPCAFAARQLSGGGTLMSAEAGTA